MSDKYKQSGVDIDAGIEAVRRIKAIVRATYSDAVVSDIGLFGGMIDGPKSFGGITHPILVQSVDSVGTKLKIASMMNDHTTIGIDMVSHSCGDVLPAGARPLTFLDYIAADKISPDHVEQIVSGLVVGCKDAGVALIGGETAELPGVYAKGEYDLVGAVLGVVEKDKMIDGKAITVGDTVLGLSSTGLHTNGYSLARKIFFADKKMSVHQELPELGESVGAALLRPHQNYTKYLLPVFDAVTVHGVAHITGGGLLENVPRILPDGVAVRIAKNAWERPPIFDVMVSLGRVADDEAYRVWNMGVGMVLIVASEDAKKTQEIIRAAGSDVRVWEIGEVVAGEKNVLLN